MKTKKSFFSIFSICLIIIFIILELFLILNSILSKDKIPDIFGYKPFFVVSGSMETSINVGDIIIVKEVSPENIKIGDIIAFRHNDYVITHRVINIQNDKDKLLFKTKGDKNTSEDDFNVDTQSLEGVMVKRIPKIGGILMFLATPSGTIIVVLLAIIVFGFYYFAFAQKRDKELLKEFEEYKKSCKSSK